MAVCQNLVPLVNIKIAGKWMFIPLKMVLIGIDPYPHLPARSTNLTGAAGACGAYIRQHRGLVGVLGIARKRGPRAKLLLRRKTTGGIMNKSQRPGR